MKESSKAAITNGLRVTKYTYDDLYTQMCCAEHERDAYVAYINGNFCSTLDDFYHEMSTALRFPDYFGYNWAAFDECLCDLDWLKFSSLFIVIDYFDSVFSGYNTQESEIGLLIKYLNIAVKYWREQKIPITVYLNYPDKKALKSEYLM